jgi:hypothetical protein
LKNAENAHQEDHSGITLAEVAQNAVAVSEANPRHA